MVKAAAIEKINESAQIVARTQLMGWLVSYGLDSKGVSFELRAGRSFVTSQPFTISGLSASQQEIVVDAKCISPAHAAISAARDQPLLVQDIFSAEGTYVIRSGSRDEIRVSGPTELSHGDWVCFGKSVRFQVCLVHG